MIEYNFAYESYSGTIMGTMKVEVDNKITLNILDIRKVSLYW
jgi:hypothetical protein